MVEWSDEVLGLAGGFLAAGHQGTYGTYPEPVVRALEDATDSRSTRRWAARE